MKVIKFKDALKFSNSDKCYGYEYPLEDKDIDVSTAVINGRYPDNEYLVNTVCKELIYVIDGTGTLHKNNEKIEFSTGRCNFN